MGWKRDRQTETDVEQFVLRERQRQTDRQKGTSFSSLFHNFPPKDLGTNKDCGSNSALKHVRNMRVK